jgi:hypothetical protein
MCHFKPLTGWKPCVFAFLAVFQIFLCFIGYSATWWQISFFGEGCPNGDDINYYISFSDGLCYSGEYGLSGSGGTSSFTSCSSWEELSNNNGNDDIITNNDHNAPDLYIKCRHLLTAAMCFAIFFTLSFTIKDGVPEEQEQYEQEPVDVESAREVGPMEPLGLTGDSSSPIPDCANASTVKQTARATSNARLHPRERKPKTAYEEAYERENYFLFAQYWNRWQYIRCFQLFWVGLVAFCLFWPSLLRSLRSFTGYRAIMASITPSACMPLHCQVLAGQQCSVGFLSVV